MATFDKAIESWKLITYIPNYEAVAGELLFRNLFTIEPAAYGLFSFSKLHELGSEALYADETFKAHVKGVIETVNKAIEMVVATEVETLLKVLQGLGKTHVKYGALPAHYDLVGEALIKTLNDALQNKFTDDVKESWLALYTVIKENMIKGAEY